MLKALTESRRTVLVVQINLLQLSAQCRRIYTAGLRQRAALVKCSHRPARVACAIAGGRLVVVERCRARLSRGGTRVRRALSSRSF